MDNVDETIHTTLEANLEHGVNKRLKPEEGEANCRIGNNLEGNNLEVNHLEGSNLEGTHHESQEEQNDHFHQEEMSEGSEVVFNVITSLLFIIINMIMMKMTMMMMMMMIYI